MRKNSKDASVEELREFGRIPWRARRRLRQVRKSGRTGVLLIAEIREPIRALTDKAGSISVRKAGEELASSSRYNRSPKFIDLTPGRHEVDFMVIRNRAKSGTSIRQAVHLREGDVLVALCDPVQSHTLYRKSPQVDSWRIGVCSASVAP